MSPSSPSWLRYDDQKLERLYMERLAAIRGTEEHAFAAKAIKLGHRLPEDPPTTLSLYINDCIGWRMKSEVPLYWSDFCFGTADGLGFSETQRDVNRPIVRVSDLKTGKNVAHFDQLLTYAALFCLEYEFPRAWEIDIELRIYQRNAVKLYVPEPDEVMHAMDRILTGTRLLETIRTEQLS